MLLRFSFWAPPCTAHVTVSNTGKENVWQARTQQLSESSDRNQKLNRRSMRFWRRGIKTTTYRSWLPTGGRRTNWRRRRIRRLLKAQPLALRPEELSEAHLDFWPESAHLRSQVLARSSQPDRLWACSPVQARELLPGD